MPTGELTVGEAISTITPEGTFNSYTYGVLPMAGDARSPTGVGQMTFHIDTPYGPIEGPVDAQVSLVPLRASCGSVTGDAAIPAGQGQSAAGFATNVTAEFTARRGAGSTPDATGVAEAERATAGDVKSYLASPTDWARVAAAAIAVKDLSAKVASAGACGQAPAGFARGVLGNHALGPLIRQLFDVAAAKHGTLDAVSLESVVEAAAEVGAPQAQLQALVAAVEDLMSRPPLSDDGATLNTILSSASRCQLSDLAAAAQAALSKLGIH